MTLSIIRIDLHFIEKSINDKDIHFMYVAKGANNAIVYTLNKLAEKYNFDSIGINLCKGILPDSIVRAHDKLLDLAYYKFFRDVDLTDGDMLQIKEDLISWFNKELNNSDDKIKAEVKQAELWIEESGDII